MAHLEDNDMLHSEILLYKVHAFAALQVLISIVIFPIKSIHHVSLKVLDEVDLAL